MTPMVVTATLVGVGHRLVSRRPVPVPTGLALIVAGVRGQLIETLAT
jgi:hypothetical protein